MHTNRARHGKGQRMIPVSLLLGGFAVLVARNAIASSFQSPSDAAALSRQLEAAKATDWQAALDPAVSPTRRGTFLNQMNKADLAIRELRYGFTVSKYAIDDALWIPPKHIAPVLRAQLIEQLEQARALDDRNEQQMLNNLAWTNSPQPADTEAFDERKREVDEVVEDLQIGAPVHWSDIKQALVVPASPY